MNVQRVSADGKVMKAANFGSQSTGASSASVQLSEEEVAKQEIIRLIWKSILSVDVTDETDFFGAGGGSMDVVRLIEELKDRVGVSLQNEDVFMATKFAEFVQCVVANLRGGSGSAGVQYDPIVLNVNNMEVSFPHQLFINGQFIDCLSGRTSDIINPTDETLICKVNSSFFIQLKKIQLTLFFNACRCRAEASRTSTSPWRRPASLSKKANGER